MILREMAQNKIAKSFHIKLPRFKEKKEKISNKETKQKKIT